MEENNKELIEDQAQEEKQEPILEVQNPHVETNQCIQENQAEIKFRPIGQINEAKPKKKKRKLGAIVFVLLLLLTIVGGLAYYYLEIYTNPKVVYQQILNKGIDSLTRTTDNISSAIMNFKLDVDLDLETDEKELIDVINSIEAATEIQMDMINKKAFIELESNYEDEELLNVAMFFDVENKKAYINLEQFFEKILEIDLEDEYYEELKKAFEIEQDTERQNTTKISKILKSEIKKIIKDEYLSKENEKITINEKEINTTKYILKITNVQIVNELKTVLENLKNNEEFLACFENKEEKKQNLEELLKEVETLQTDEEKSAIYVKMYRTGLKQDVVKVEFEIESQGEKLTLKFEKTEKAYNFELKFKEEMLCTGALVLEKVNESTIKIDFRVEIKDLGTIALDAQYGCILNEGIDEINTNDALKMTELSQGDILKAYEKLEDSKLYEILEGFLYGGDSDLEDSYNEDEENQIDTETDDKFSTKLVRTEEGAFIILASNNSNVPLDMDVEVEFYDETGLFVGNATEELTAVGAGKEVAMEMLGVPAKFSTYKIYVDAEESDEKAYFDKVEMTHNNNGENIAVQVKNNSQDVIEYITVAVVYYDNGEVVGITSGINSNVKPGRAGNFVLDFPCDSNYKNIEFDDYKVFVTEAYTSN